LISMHLCYAWHFTYQIIYVKASSRRTIDEEIPEAYKDVTNVVDACQLAGISKKVAQLRPLGCIKG